DREGKSKRNNWLLIKRSDEAARPGDRDRLLAEDKSVASGRKMADIAAGKGHGPAPFMTAKRAPAPPDAIWTSNRAETDATAKQRRKAPKRREKKRTAALRAAVPSVRPSAKRTTPQLPEFIAPQLAKLVDRPPPGTGWAHEIKFDGYRMQLRVA